MKFFLEERNWKVKKASLFFPCSEISPEFAPIHSVGIRSSAQLLERK